MTDTPQESIEFVVVTWCGRDRGVVRDDGIWCGCGRGGFERQIHEKGGERHESRAYPRSKLSIYTQAGSLRLRTLTASLSDTVHSVMVEVELET